MDMMECAYDYSVRVAELVRYLKEDGRDFPLSDKLLDCAVAAGLAARKKERKAAADCVEQSDYMIEMAAKGGYLTERQAAPIREESRKLILMLRESG